MFPFFAISPPRSVIFPFKDLLPITNYKLRITIPKFRIEFVIVLYFAE